MTLRRKLYLGFLSVALLPAALITAVHSTIYLNLTEENADIYGVNLAQAAAQSLNQLLQNAARDIHGIALGLRFHGDKSSTAGQLAAYGYAYPYYSEILWIDAQGVVYASSNSQHHGQRLTHLYPELADDWLEVQRRPVGVMHVSDLDDVSAVTHSDAEKRREGQNALTLQLLLRVERPNAPKGVLLLVMNNASIVGVLQDFQHRLPDAAPVLLLNNGGDILLSSDPLQQPFIRHPLAGRIAGLFSASADGGRFLEGEMDGVLMAVAVAETTGIGLDHQASWRVLLSRPEDRLLAPIHKVMYMTLGLLILIMAGVSFIGYKLANSVVFPIESLAAVVARISGGDLMARAQVTSNDEIGKMSSAFNNMAATIERERHALIFSNRELEQRARERSTALSELETRNQQGRLLAEITGLLQTVRDVNEAMQILPRFLAPMFAPHAGALYNIKASFNYLELQAQWGDAPFVRTIEVDDCWGLRRGQAYLVEDDPRALVCHHTGLLPPGGAALCIPMMAQGVTVGMLYLLCAGLESDSRQREAWLENARRVAEQLAMGIANLKLRGALREQSIRDPLTGLHNRRFLEESLARELERAERDQHSFAVFMMDVDHFKRFNDLYGHEAGDAVLRALGRLLKEETRAGDLACRFGGEEFTLVLSPADLGQAREWAARLMERVRLMEVKSGSQTLPAITISLGLAMYPGHGLRYDTLLQAADLALYDAKHNGRDRLMVSGEQAQTNGVTD